MKFKFLSVLSYLLNAINFDVILSLVVQINSLIFIEQIKYLFKDESLKNILIDKISAQSLDVLKRMCCLGSL